MTHAEAKAIEIAVETLQAVALVADLAAKDDAANRLLEASLVLEGMK
jgi:hypothetical protein